MVDRQLHRLVTCYIALNAGDKQRGFMRFYGHTGHIEMDVHKDGWDINHDPDKRFAFFIDGVEDKLDELENYVKEVCDVEG